MAGDALEIFFSYSHKDEKLRDRLAEHLALLRREGKLRDWHDRKITAGREWSGEIDTRLEAAQIVLLLVSPAFLASDYCYDVEMKRALARHDAGEARVIPIILKPCSWKNAPFSKLQSLPRDGKAVTKWGNRDDAFLAIEEGLRLAIAEEATRPAASAPPPALAGRPLRVVLLIGHSVADPLPTAAEMAKAAVLDFQAAGLAVDLRVDQATSASFRREAEAGCDVFIYYGHGTEAGELGFADGRQSFAALSGEGLESFWRQLPVCFLFACYGDRFARQLLGPWVAFAEPILTQAPKGFLHALLPALGQLDLAAAVARARALCEGEMASSFTRVMRFSAAPLPPLRAAAGTVRLGRVSPALANHHRLDFGSLDVDGHLYLDHDPFVGRRADLERLLRLPTPFDDRPLQRVVWVQGGPGMGKSALLRQFAIHVRDLAFRPAEEPVYLLHLHCYKHTRAEEVVAALCERARELYGLAAVPASLEELFAVLQKMLGTRGTHVWVLDDLTYLAARPDKSEEAARLVFGLRDLANVRVLRCQLVVSSRQAGPVVFEELCVEALSGSEAQELALRVWAMRRGAARVAPAEVMAGAAQLFRLVGSTSQYKRALSLAADLGMGYRAYADELADATRLETQDRFEEARRMVAFELGHLEALETKHGFAYRGFLAVYYPLIARAASFTAVELETWFGDRFALPARVSVPVAYRNGLGYLVGLNFLMIEKRDGGEVFAMPPNQRWTMRALSDLGGELPAEVPLRGARERLSLALERAALGDLDAFGDLLLMESDYGNDLEDPAAAAAVFYSMVGRSELESDRQAIETLGRVVALYDAHRSDDPARADPAAEPVARALVNKGFRLGALGESAAAIAVYDAVVSRYGDRQEPALAEQVAKALVNKGFRLGALGESAAEIAVYAAVVSRYGDRQEPALAEQVASALGSKGWRCYELGDYALSAASSRAALVRVPGETWIRCNLGLALLHLGEIDAARETYAAALAEIRSVEDLDRMALTDLDAALAARPDLPGGQEICSMILKQREELQGKPG